MTIEQVRPLGFAVLGLAILVSCSTGNEFKSAAVGGSTSNLNVVSGTGATGGGSGVTSFVGGATAAQSSSTGGSPGAISDIHANVTAVLVRGAEGNYVFDVSVESSDIDCSQYANWWEVLDQNGSLLYKKILNHCHTDENGTSDPDAPGNTFTRSSDPDTIPLHASQVAIVRAHMNTAGYCGIAMRGTPTDGFAAAPDIGSGFAADVEHEDPQPTGCLF
jgi:hypothetical protein